MRVSLANKEKSRCIRASQGRAKRPSTGPTKRDQGRPRETKADQEGPRPTKRDQQRETERDQSKRRRPVPPPGKRLQRSAPLSQSARKPATRPHPPKETLSPPSSRHDGFHARHAHPRGSGAPGSPLHSPSPELVPCTPLTSPQKALQSFYGVGPNVAARLCAKLSIHKTALVGSVPASKINSLAEKMTDMTLEMDLRRTIRDDIRRLHEMGAYRGKRHAQVSGAALTDVKDDADGFDLGIAGAGPVYSKPDQDGKEIEPP